MEWKKLMDAGALADDLDQAWELRLRPGQPMEALFPWGWQRGESILTSRQVLQAAQALSAHGLAAGSRQLARGFLPLPGGHRLGVAGVMGERGHAGNRKPVPAHRSRGEGLRRGDFS